MRYVIAAFSDRAESFWWNNEEGWTSEPADAALFSAKERESFDLPAPPNEDIWGVEWCVRS